MFKEEKPMDASRLLEVLDDVEKELEGGLTRLLNSVLQQYTIARDSPTLDNAPAILAAYASVVEYIQLGTFSEYPPSKAEILKAIGGDKYVGPGIRDRLQTIFSVPGGTPAGVVTSLTAFVAEVNSFKKSCVQVRAGLKALGLTPHMIPSGEFEVGVLIPEVLVDSKLSSLVKELGTWNKIVRGYQEVTGEEEREVTVTGLASGSYQFYLPLGLAAATYLSLTIDKILDWYLKIMEIRKHRKELENLGALGADILAVQKHEKELVEKGIVELAKEIVKEVHPKVGLERTHELETHLTVSIRQITRFVNKGGTVEVTSTPPETTEEPEPLTDAATSEEVNVYNRLLNEQKKLSEQVKKLNEIIKSGSALRQLPARPEPILQLEMDAEDEDTSTPEKQPKKKPEKPS
jgi:hypothetical protein